MSWKKMLKDFFNIKPKETKPKELRMYVLVRQDLAETYRMVQGAHAVAQYALNGLNATIQDNNSIYCNVFFKEWKNQYLIFLGVPNYISLKEWKNKLDERGKTFSAFYEPDLDNQLTAIACIESSVSDFFKELPLAK